MSGVESAERDAVSWYLKQATGVRKIEGRSSGREGPYRRPALGALGLLSRLPLFLAWGL